MKRMDAATIAEYEGYARELFDRQEQLEGLMRGLPDAIDGVRGVEELCAVLEEAKEQADGLHEEIASFKAHLDELAGNVPRGVIAHWGEILAA